MSYVVACTLMTDLYLGAWCIFFPRLIDYYWSSGRNVLTAEIPQRTFISEAAYSHPLFGRKNQLFGLSVTTGEILVHSFFLPLSPNYITPRPAFSSASKSAVSSTGSTPSPSPVT